MKTIILAILLTLNLSISVFSLNSDFQDAKNLNNQVELGKIEAIGILLVDTDDSIIGLPYRLDTGWRLLDPSGGGWYCRNGICQGGPWEIGESLLISIDDIDSEPESWVMIYNLDRDESRLLQIMSIPTTKGDQDETPWPFSWIIDIIRSSWQ